MKALIVGLGSVGRRHARNWAALGLGEVWVCRQTNAPLPEPLGVEVRSSFTSLQEALSAGPDVVIVCNPTSLHVRTALAAIRAGCHVLVEKPISESLAGVAELLAEAKARRRKLLVGYNLRLHPGLARTRELLFEGAIGRPLAARAEMGEYLPGWHPWEDYRQGYSARQDLGGGPVLTFSHELDSLCWLLGAPVQLTCLTSHASSLEIDTEDVADMAVRFGSGVLASVHMDYVRRPPLRRIEVVGEEGVLRWEYDENRVLVYSPLTRQWRVEEGDPRFDRNDIFLEELRLLAASLRGDAEWPLADGEQAAAILALAVAAHRSASEGRAITLLEDLPGETRPWLERLAIPPTPSPHPRPTSFASTTV